MSILVSVISLCYSCQKPDVQFKVWISLESLQAGDWEEPETINAECPKCGALNSIVITAEEGE